MRDYLISFFKEFEYEKEDAEFFISVYDEIAANEKASSILNEALAAYEADIMIDHQEEILGRAKTISNITLIHPYTVDLLLYFCLTRHLKSVYVEKGLDMQIYRNTVLDLKWKLNECKEVKGIRGSFVARWFGGFFKLGRFALGRLQFVPKTIDRDYEKDGVKLTGGVSRVIDVHIPRDGTPLDKESCDKAYAMAREFYKDEVGENAPFICHSWLLFPENKNLLSEKSNIYRFISEYDIVDFGYDEGGDLWRLFDTNEVNPDRLPTDTSMRRAYVEHLKNGGRVGWGFGIKTN